MSDFYLNERIMQQQVAEEHHQATLRRLQKETGAGHTSWLARQRCRIFSWLGSSLVASGQRLIQFVSQPAPGTEGRASRGS